MASIVRHLAVVLLVLIASAPHAATAKSGKDSRLPGEGMWRLRFRTLWAEGDGCGEYDMDVRVSHPCPATRATANRPPGDAMGGCRDEQGNIPSRASCYCPRGIVGGGGEEGGRGEGR